MLRGVLFEDLLAHPLRRRSLAAADSQMSAFSGAVDLDSPSWRLCLGRHRHDRTRDAKLPQRGIRNPLDVALSHHSIPR